MGVGFQVTSTPWKRRLWARPSVAGLAKEVRAVYGQLLREPLLAARLEVHAEGQNVYASWHPAGGGLELELLESGCLCATASTNSVGPGLHAHLIDVLDALAEKLSITWNFDGDETNFASTRDAGALQQEMLNWLRTISKMCLLKADEGVSNIGLSVQIGRPRPRHPSLAYSSQGTWSREDFAGAAHDPEKLRDFGARFFPWWSRDMDASFWFGIARAVAWCDVAWVSPRDAGERATTELALACFDRARGLDRALEASSAFDELRALASGTLQLDTPRPEGMGHRRVLNQFQLMGAWTLDIGGHFVTHVLDDGALQLEDRRRSVHISSLRIDNSDGASSACALLATDSAAAPDLSWQHEHVLGHATWFVEGPTRHLRALVAVDGRLLLLTISDAPDAPRGWSEAVAMSARHPQPDD